jgi:hypothetical protein
MGPTVPIPPEMAQYVGGVLHADTPHRYWDVPTIVLAPGQAITKTQTTMESSRWVTFTIPYEPGEYGLVYTFDDRAHAAFKVLQPLKATAIAAVALPPVEIADIRTNHQRVMHSGTAILLVVEISPQDYRLVRAAMFRDISGHLNPNNPASFLRELYGYETVGTFGEEVTSLKASMANGDTVDVTAITASQREIHMNVPAQPAKTASTEKQ